MNKNVTVILGGLLALAAGAAWGAPSSNVAWTPQIKNMVDRASPERGRAIAVNEPEDVSACADCHGEAGDDPSKSRTPMISGQTAHYIYKQLRDYKDGTRENRRMEEAAQLLSDQQMAELGAWYASQPYAKPELDEDEKVTEAAVELVFLGDKTRLIQPCAACHGRKGEGAIMNVPALAGQSVKYFVSTMKDYAKGERANDVYSRMRIIASKLTREEIEELAIYYASLSQE
jgi:cytochrome c553